MRVAKRMGEFGHLALLVVEMDVVEIMLLGSGFLKKFAAHLFAYHRLSLEASSEEEIEDQSYYGEK